MTLRVSTLRGAVLTLAAGAALAFGATTALARPAAACADPNAVGTCTTTSDCRKICNRLSNGLIPDCDTGASCCYCQKL